MLIAAYFSFYLFYRKSGLDMFFGVNSLFLAVITIVSIFGIYRDGMLSKKRIESKIIEFTDKIKSYEKIRLFAGDLSFLGNVKDGSIEKNNQYIQLKNLCDNNSCEVEIICHKPKNNDSVNKERIGFILSNIQNVSIEFYSERKCYHQDNKNCRNPDLNLRGRIISDRNGLEHIFLTDNSENRNKLKSIILNSSTKEGKLYIKLWNLWWEKCDEDYESLNNYKDYYLNSKQII